jgi:hypothetical protein
MTWYAVSVPPSASLLLGRCRVRRYSETQALAGILHSFARLPPEERATLARQYLQEQQTPPDPEGATDCRRPADEPCPDGMASPLAPMPLLWRS